MVDVRRIGAGTIGTGPQLGDAELVTLAVMQALLEFHLRGLLAAARPRSPAALVSLSAPAAWLQQAPARRRVADPALHPRSGHRRHWVDRRRVGGGFHPGRVRPVTRDCETF